MKHTFDRRAPILPTKERPAGPNVMGAGSKIRCLACHQNLTREQAAKEDCRG